MEAAALLGGVEANEETPLKRSPRRRWAKVLTGAYLFACLVLGAGGVRTLITQQQDLHVVEGVHGLFDIAACADYDDDQVYPMRRPAAASQMTAGWSTSCTADDYLSYCDRQPPWESHPRRPFATRLGPVIGRFCSEACIDDKSSYVMPCMWQLVANLPRVCDGTFVPRMPDQSQNREPIDDVQTMRHDDESPYNEVELYPCDEHAVCSACSPANENCLAVAEHYGTLRDPRVVDRHPHNRSGATIAEQIFQDDFDYWCHLLTGKPPALVI